MRPSVKFDVWSTHGVAVPGLEVPGLARLDRDEAGRRGLLGEVEHEVEGAAGAGVLDLAGTHEASDRTAGQRLPWLPPGFEMAVV